jgi:hypothetical protein
MKRLLDGLTSLLAKTLHSRKFWAAIAASGPFSAIGDWSSFAYVWMTYAGIQGAVDASEGLGARKATAVPETAQAVSEEAPSQVPTEDAA